MLLKWYSSNKRDFPWRNTGHPYPVFISEFFLQKTKAEDVVRPYTEFISTYPNINSLSKACLADVSLKFEKLGLTYRGKRIISAAQVIVETHKSIIPSCEESLLKIPGIGKYSAGAILCFGFGMRRAILDGNVSRIYSRIFNFQPASTRSRDDKGFWNFAEVLLPESNFVDFNYALLDFGAKICSFRKPKCTTCPFKSDCKMYLSNGVGYV